ncbi:hypothetical protein BDV59DRAFT_180055 [Aspergillus ambiguus]|uniref:uncharacterized protein n=1 Tax=Aspergillus ambiguus TaxID=176160 RepID=UPI003CCE4928
MASHTSRTPSESRLSTRLSLRWLPDPAFENTDTIVMSVKGWYVDLRVDRESGAIDWAIAGQRVVDSHDPHRVQFTHELDSNNSFDTVDCGTFSTLPNGDDLETGSMPRPDLPGAPVTAYEEVWRELGFQAGPEGDERGISWILESKYALPKDLGDVGEIEVPRTFLARIWGTYLALRQVQTVILDQRSKTLRAKHGKDVSARREEWSQSTGWASKYIIGDEGDKLPSMADIAHEGTEHWGSAGATITVQEREYTVRAIEIM